MTGHPFTNSKACDLRFVLCRWERMLQPSRTSKSDCEAKAVPGSAAFHFSSVVAQSKSAARSRMFGLQCVKRYVVSGSFASASIFLAGLRQGRLSSDQVC